MSRVLEYIDSTPWAMSEEGISLIRAIAAREDVRAHNIEAIGREPGQAMVGSPRATVRDGVAILALSGPLFRYANLFTAISGATSLEVFAQTFGKALEDPTIRGIILDVNSPGGEVAGSEETAKLIASARGVKPVATLFSGVGASAAYWIGAAAEKVYTIESAIVGNVGTVLTIDVEKTKGERLVFVSSQSPRKRPDPQTVDGKAAIQELLDALAQVFIEQVAAFRGLTAEQVINDFGQGGVLVGAAAVKAGMADGVHTLETLITELSGRTSAFGRSAAAMAAGGITPPTGGIMADKEEKPPAITRAYLDANHPELVAAIRAEGAEEGTAKVGPAVTAERERITGVLGLLVDEKGVARAAAKGFEEIVLKAVAKPGQTKAETALELVDAKEAKDTRAKAGHLDRLREDEGQGAPPPSAEGGHDEGEAALIARATRIHRELKGESAAPSQN